MRTGRLRSEDRHSGLQGPVPQASVPHLLLLLPGLHQLVWVDTEGEDQRRGCAHRVPPLNGSPRPAPWSRPADLLPFHGLCIRAWASSGATHCDR